MKIGFDAKRIFHNNTGLGNYGRDVIRILDQYTPIDTFFLYNTKPSKTNRLSDSAKVFTKYPENWFWKKFSSLWRLGAITKQITKDQVDIYHGLSGEIPAGLKRKKIAKVVTIHDLIFFSHPHYYNFFDRIIYAKKFRHAAHNSDKIIAISEQTKKDAIKYLGVNANKIEVIYQGCNSAFKKVYDQATKEAVRKKYDLPEKFVLNVGTIQERKNALTIVKAINGTPHKLIVIGGEKKYAKKVHDYIKINDLVSQVTFLKNVSINELAIIYQLSTIFCYPSICEGFGIPIIEALFSKVPVITSVGSCFPEAGGPHSMYIDPNDIKALRAAMNSLFADETIRKKISDEGFKFVQKFTDDKVANNLYTLYKSLIP